MFYSIKLPHLVTPPGLGFNARDLDILDVIAKLPNLQQTTFDIYIDIYIHIYISADRQHTNHRNPQT